MQKIILILSLFCLSRTFACVCVEELNVEEAFTKADLVIIGVVEDQLFPESEIQEDGSEIFTMGMISLFSVKEIFKGKKVDNFPIETFGTSCDIAFQKGDHYLLYANIENGIVSTNICMRTDEIQYVKKSEIETLRKLKEHNKASERNAEHAPRAQHPSS